MWLISPMVGLFETDSLFRNICCWLWHLKRVQTGSVVVASSSYFTDDVSWIGVASVWPRARVDTLLTECGDMHLRPPLNVISMHLGNVATCTQSCPLVIRSLKIDVDTRSAQHLYSITATPSRKAQIYWVQNLTRMYLPPGRAAELTNSWVLTFSQQGVHEALPTCVFWLLQQQSIWSSH